MTLVGGAKLGVLWGDVCKVMVGGEAMCLSGGWVLQVGGL